MRIIDTKPIFALLATITLGSGAHAQSIRVTVDGEEIRFFGQAPMEQNGSVLVPLRGVFEKLGANVAYDSATRTILAVRGSRSVTLALGSTAATVNGQPRTLSIPALARNGTTLVPLRFVSEALGAGVDWRSDSQTVVIETSGMTVPENNIQERPERIVAIQSVTHDGNRSLRAGDTLTVTATGTPGGRAMFSIPTINQAKNVPMRETEQGVYVGTFVLPTGVKVRDQPVLVVLRKNGTLSESVSSERMLNIDSMGPMLSRLTPTPNSTLSPSNLMISGTFSDEGSQVMPETMRLTVNGNNVTTQAMVTPNFFSYRPERALPYGRNRVVVLVKDRTGNETRRTWEFTLARAPR